MLKIGSTSMKVICQPARECHAKITENAQKLTAMYSITNVIAQRTMRGEIVKYTRPANQRIAMEGSVYPKNQIPTISFVCVLWVEWVCSVKQVRGYRFLIGAIFSKTNDLNSCMHVQCNRKKNINMTMSLAVVSIFPRNREAEVRFRVDNSVFFH